MSLWRVTRNKLRQAEPFIPTHHTPPPLPSPQTFPTSTFTPSKIKTTLAMDEETRIKYFALEHVFWIRLADFMDIVPRYQHLFGLQIRCAPMALEAPPSVEPAGDAGEDEQDRNGNLIEHQHQHQTQAQAQTQQSNGVVPPQTHHDHGPDYGTGSDRDGAILGGGLTNGYH